METTTNNRVCPESHAGLLTINLRSFLQNPHKILSPFVQQGMTILDVGCGPGFFTIPAARLTGNTGKVLAADLQSGMLEKLRNKISCSGDINNIQLIKCSETNVNVQEKVDFIILFYMLHEVPNKFATIRELKSLLRPDGKILWVEPKIHVTGKEFDNMESIFTELGFRVYSRPKVFFSRSAILKIKY